MNAIPDGVLKKLYGKVPSSVVRALACIGRYGAKLEKTNWYPSDVKPVHHGWYERDYTKTTHYVGDQPVQMCFWTGTEWSAGQGEAYKIPYFASADQNLPWRGLQG